MDLRDAMGRTVMVLSALKGNVQNLHHCLASHPKPEEAVDEADKHGVTALECE